MGRPHTCSDKTRYFLVSMEASWLEPFAKLSYSALPMFANICKTQEFNVMIKHRGSMHNRPR